MSFDKVDRKGSVHINNEYVQKKPNYDEIS